MNDIPTRVERWLPVADYAGYEVSNLGNVRSLDRTVVTRGGPRRYKGRMLRTTPTNGYPCVKLGTPESGQATRPVHQLVMAAFAGPCPPGQEVRHLNDVKTDCHWPENLAYGTKKENFADRIPNGRTNRGERNGHARLTWEQVREIRARADGGESHRLLAADFGVTFQNIHCVVRNKSWVEQAIPPFRRDSGVNRGSQHAAAGTAVRDLVQEDVPPRERNDASECWRAVPGFESRYEVSNRGRVRSLDRVIKNIRTRRWPGKILAQPRSWGGYPSVRLSDFGKHRTFLVHILVLTVFAGPCPEGQEALHGPDGRLDASIGNLHWGTRRENVLDRIRDGTHNRGERHGMARLTQAQVDEIRVRWAAGETQTALGAEFGTTPGNVCAIVRHRSWIDT